LVNFAGVNRKSFISIIIVMTIALIGLMFIQSYWIRNAITVRQANFNKSVNDALASVVYKLERIESDKVFHNRMNYYKYGPNILRTIDSLNSLLFNNINPFSGMWDIDRFYKKSFLAQDILENMFNVNRNVIIEDRVDPMVLDSLINFELHNRGINTQYEFGLFSPARNLMPLQKTGKYPRELLSRGFSFILFPSDMYSNPDYLMLYFPKEKRFLLSQLWGMLSISIFLILVIILSFSYTVVTILRQKKLSEMKSDFVNNMTHEFKTPISTIALACEAINDVDLNRSGEVLDSYVGIIREENKRLETISERILQSATLDKGLLKLNMETVDIHQVIGQAADKISLQVERKGGRIVRNLEARAPAIEGDRVHLTNMLLNLLDNANKYTPAKPEIVISTHNDHRGVTLSVTDNGIGIRRSDQKKIFEKLFRVHTGDIHNVKGFGLGLSYVKAIVEQHGGDISLASELNRGSRFTVFLPYKSDSNK